MGGSQPWGLRAKTLGQRPPVVDTSTTMAQRTAEQFILDMYAAFVSEGLAEASVRFMAEGVEYADDPRWPGGGTHHGRDAVVARFEEVAEVLGIVNAGVERVVDAEGQVAWIVRFSGRS